MNKAIEIIKEELYWMKKLASDVRKELKEKWQNEIVELESALTILREAGANNE